MATATVAELKLLFPSVDKDLIQMTHEDCRGNKMECLAQLKAFGPMVTLEDEPAAPAPENTRTVSSEGMTSTENSHDVDVGEPSIHPCLQRDIDLANALGFKTEVLVTVGVRVTIYVPVNDIVTPSLSRAWGFSHRDPFAIQLRFDTLDYIECSKPPQVTVTQNEEPCRYGQQIRSFLSHYLASHWGYGGWKPPIKTSFKSKNSPETDQAVSKKLPENQEGSAAKVENEEQHVDPNAPADSAPLEASPSSSSFFGTLFASLSERKQAMMDQLCHMGFAAAAAFKAVTHATSVDEAVEKCLTNKDEKEDTPASVLKILPSAAAKLSDEDPNKYVEYREREEGFLLHLAYYVKHRTNTAHHYCVICDQTHLFASSMLKACVCERAICNFQFQELCLGKDAAENVAMGAGVMDLLITIFRNAVMCSRAPQVCSPYPTVPDPSKPGRLALNPKEPDFKKLKELVSMLPVTSELVGMTSVGQLSDGLGKKDPLLSPLLNWIIASNRSHVVRLADNECIKQMGTPHQFYISSDSPERQLKFQKAKEAANEPEPLFMFHGTASANLFSILHNGLVIQANACRELWMAREAATSVGYMYRDGESATSLYAHLQGAPQVDPKAAVGASGSEYFDGRSFKDMAAMLLLEVSHKDAWAQRSQQPICTVANPDFVSVRMIFLFTAPEQIRTAQAQGKTNDPAFLDQVKKLMKTYHT